MDLKNYIGKKVKSYRAKEGLTQDGLAEKTGKAVETISNIERGYSYTSLETLELIAKSLNCSMVDLLPASDNYSSLSSKQQDILNKLAQNIDKFPSKNLSVLEDMVDSMIKNS